MGKFPREYTEPGKLDICEEQDTYTSIDATPLIVKIPQGKQRTITFNVGPEEGEVCVKVGEETLSFNLKQSEVVETGLPFALQ